MEQALQRLAEFADEHEGAGQGHRYLALSRFLLDSRRGGEEFDQAYRPVVALPCLNTNNCNEEKK